MLKIRDEQVAALDQASLRRFEDETARHLKQFAPKHSEVIKEGGVRTVIRLGIDRASRYDLVDRGPVRFFIECMFMFGSEFDTDPMLPWAGEALNDPAVVDQAERAGQLYQGMLGYVDRVAGPNNEYAIEALRRIDRARVEDYPVSAANFEEVALRGLRDMYPQKCEDAGESALRGLIRGGIEQARRHSAASDVGVALFIALRFALGHGFATDPLFPWISGALNDPLVADPSKRVARLHTRMKTYLAEALAYLERR